MRGRYPPCDKAIRWQLKDIKTTDEVACLRIYHDINPGSENDAGVAGLLTALGHMPFAVTLMAKLGMESQSTAKDLLDAWSESGPDILSNNPEDSMNRSIRLSVESDLVKQNPNASPPRYLVFDTSGNDQRESALVGSGTQDIDDPLPHRYFIPGRITG